MKEIKTRSRSDFTTLVRRDKRKAHQSLTKGKMIPSYSPKNSKRTGDWKKWWREGCGTNLAGQPVCPPGHAYYIEKYDREAHRRTKILGRRKERRRLKKIDEE